jgi:hypothetical protein
MKWRGVTAVALAFAGVGLLVAQEQKPRAARVSPSVLREALSVPVVTTAASAPSLGHSIQDLKTLASDLEKDGRAADSERLTVIVKNLTRLAERRYQEKKDQLDKLQSEMDELKWASER